MIAQSAMEGMGKSFGFFEYAKVGIPILIVGIFFFALIGYKLLPDAKPNDDVVFDEKISVMFQNGNSGFH